MCFNDELAVHNFKTECVQIYTSSKWYMSNIAHYQNNFLAFKHKRYKQHMTIYFLASFTAVRPYLSRWSTHDSRVFFLVMSCVHFHFGRLLFRVLSSSICPVFISMLVDPCFLCFLAEYVLCPFACRDVRIPGANTHETPWLNASAASPIVIFQ